jgi:hypothetical protein
MKKKYRKVSVDYKIQCDDDFCGECEHRHYTYNMLDTKKMQSQYWCELYEVRLVDKTKLSRKYGIEYLQSKSDIAIQRCTECKRSEKIT